MGFMSGYESVANNALNQWATPSLSTNNFSFLDGLSNLGGYAKSGFNFLNNNSQGIGALGGLWGAYNQYNMGNKIYDMQKDAYAYNKALSEREKKRQEDAEKALQLGFTNSTIGA